MIKLTRLNGYEIVVNAELIEYVEAKPNTTLYMATGSKILVREGEEEVIEKIIEYRKRISAEGKSPVENLLKTYHKEGR